MASIQDVMREHGIVADPDEVIAVCAATGLPRHVMCPKLRRESYGGRNVFGNDRVAYPASGPYTADIEAVTRPAVEAYLLWRGPGPAAGTSGRQNGVGPSQLTWWSLQDEAERRGGLHVPRVNMEVGAEEFARLLDAADGDLREAAGRYNGGTNWTRYGGAIAYAQYMVDEAAKWRIWLEAASTGGASPSVPSPAGDPDSIPTMREGDVGAHVHKLAAWFNKWFPIYVDTPIPLDADPARQRYGPTTVRVVAEFQRRCDITGPDAVGTPVGPRTKGALWAAGYRP